MIGNMANVPTYHDQNSHVHIINSKERRLNESSNGDEVVVTVEDGITADSHELQSLAHQHEVTPTRKCSFA